MLQNTKSTHSARSCTVHRALQSMTSSGSPHPHDDMIMIMTPRPWPQTCTIVVLEDSVTTGIPYVQDALTVRPNPFHHIGEPILLASWPFQRSTGVCRHVGAECGRSGKVTFGFVTNFAMGQALLSALFSMGNVAVLVRVDWRVCVLLFRIGIVRFLIFRGADLHRNYFLVQCEFFGRRVRFVCRIRVNFRKCLLWIVSEFLRD